MLKALKLVAHLMFGIGLAAWLTLGGSRRRSRERFAQSWSWRLLEILEVRLRMEGSPLREAHLTVSNHVSWLDIPVLSAMEPTRFVSKSEVRDWPIAGWLANAAGTFYLRRGKSGCAPLLERLVPHLRRGGSAVLFPEGTTTDGQDVRPFHARLFQAALDARCPVQPVTLQYALAEDGSNPAAFVGDDSLAGSILRVMRGGPIEVRVAYGPPIRADRSRDELAQEAEAYVRGALQPGGRTSGAFAESALQWASA